MNLKYRVTRCIAWLSALLIIAGCAERSFETNRSHSREEAEAREYPGEWLYKQRAFPFDTIRSDVYRAAVVQARQMQPSPQRSHQASWELVGPVNIGGRVTDISLDPTDQDIMYASTANGGVFRTRDGGETWEHIFKDVGRLSIGNIEVASANPNIIYVGTGEANGSATSGAFFGDGMYRSDDGGDTWTHIGLEQSQYIARIVVDPDDAQKVFAAATGVLYGKDTHRGIYRTTNGGQDWEQVLFVNDSVAAIDIAMDPRHPDTLFAAMWERQRHPNVRDYAGIGSGVYRSFDGGDTWTRMTMGLPVNQSIGRIGVAVGGDGAVYASYSDNQITNDFLALYKSVNAGETWAPVDNNILLFQEIYAGFGWYFGNVRVDPVDPAKVYVLGLNVWESTDAGSNWVQHTAPYVHVDNHALEIHPQNPQLHVLGCDGGIYISRNGGDDWTHVESLPISEFYTCEIDPLQPDNYYGGAQDNGTLRTLTGSIDDWQRIFGGDGFYVLVDPTDNQIIYCEYQNGFMYKSTDGGFEWDYALSGVNGSDRTNWNTPYVISPHNHNRLYYGTHRLWTSIDGAENWTVISEDLTNTDPNSPGGEDFGALSTIAVAPSDSNVIYTGSEDGYVFVTMDGGGLWQRISDALPIRYVTRVAVDPYDALIAYVTISGYKEVDYMPHIFRTVNGGVTWEDISGNLPEVPLNDVIIDPDLPATLYVASDVGVWYTNDLGVQWDLLGTGQPLTSYQDLTLHRETRKLLAASFGLSMYVYDLNDPSTSTEGQWAVLTQMKVYPNPITETATIEIALKEPGTLAVQVFDLQGRLVSTPYSGKGLRGKNTLTWVRKGNLASGTYIVLVRVGEGSVSRIVELL